MKPNPLGLATGILLMLVGTVWILQGFDIAFAPRSFMTDNKWWVLWGLVAVAGGLLLILRFVRNR